VRDSVGSGSKEQPSTSTEGRDRAPAEEGILCPDDGAILDRAKKEQTAVTTALIEFADQTTEVLADNVASDEDEHAGTKIQPVSTHSESQENESGESKNEQVNEEENTDPASGLSKQQSIEATNPGEAAAEQANAKTNLAGVSDGEVPFVVVDRDDGDTEEPKMNDNTHLTGPPAYVAAQPASVAGATGRTPSYAAPSRAAQTAPATGVDPTAQTTVNPDEIIEERGEIPDLYVGKIIGKVGNGILVVLRPASFAV
jgi:hypothetical protein